MAQPGGDGVIGTSEQRTEDRRVEAGVETEEVVLLGCPARSGTSGFRPPRRREPEGARTASDRFGGSPEPSGGVV
jgi:hypothetical protein